MRREDKQNLSGCIPHIGTDARFGSTRCAAGELSPTGSSPCHIRQAPEIAPRAEYSQLLLHTGRLPAHEE
ncbi:hypothetical protein SHJG_3066 [Streptomyces hygroscopicus subsp. jinggangensis 5008]|nr:hypothetical protein SHJG_3066 [Streptomyces hygroscopicus subsp. jinggangensis 5008]